MNFQSLTLGEKYKVLKEGSGTKYEDTNPYYFWYKNYKALEDLSHEVTDVCIYNHGYTVVTEKIDTKVYKHKPTLYIYTIITRITVVTEGIPVDIKYIITFNSDKGIYTLSGRGFKAVGTSVKEAFQNLGIYLKE